MNSGGRIVQLVDGRQLLETSYPCQIDFWGRGYSMTTNVVRVSELAYTAEKALKFHVKSELVSRFYPETCETANPARVSGLALGKLKDRLLRPLLTENDDKVVVAPKEEEDTLFETVKYISEQSLLNASNFQRVDPESGIMIQVATGYCQDAPQPADPSKKNYVLLVPGSIPGLGIIAADKEYRILGRSYTFRDADGHSTECHSSNQVFANISTGSEEAMGVVGLTPLLRAGESFIFHSGVRIPTTETGTFTGALEIGCGKKAKDDDAEASDEADVVKRERLDVRYRKHKDESKDVFFLSLPDVAFKPTAVAVKLQDNFDRFRYFAERVEHLSALGYIDETAEGFPPGYWTKRRKPVGEKTQSILTGVISWRSGRFLEGKVEAPDDPMD